MSAIGKVENGEVVNATKTESTVKTGKGNSSLDKDAFLQLLVAQMKYQDPMEPTSNTEYVAQYATFSQVEALQNMQKGMESQNALTLVGKYVTMDTESGTVSGRVDYAESSNGKMLLYIDGKAYDASKLNTVWDEEYLDAYNLASKWSASLTALPKTEDLTLEYADAIEKLRNTYNDMSVYQKSYIGSSLTSLLEAAEKKIAALRAMNEKSEDETETEEVDA